MSPEIKKSLNANNEIELLMLILEKRGTPTN
jgi:hypothetical protein